MNRSLVKRKPVSTACTSKVNDVKCKIIDEKKKVSTVASVPIKLDTYRSCRNNVSSYEKRSLSPSTKASSTFSCSSSSSSSSSSSASSSASSCVSSGSTYSSSSSSCHNSSNCKSKISQRSILSKNSRCISNAPLHQVNQCTLSNNSRIESVSNETASEHHRKRSNLPTVSASMKDYLMKGKRYTSEVKKVSQIATSKCVESGISIAKVSPLPVASEKDNSMKKIDVQNRAIITSSECSSPSSSSSPPPPALLASTAASVSFSSAASLSPVLAPPPPAPPSPVRKESNCNTVTTSAAAQVTTATTFTLDHCTRTANKKVILLPQEAEKKEEERDGEKKESVPCVTVEEKEEGEKGEEKEDLLTQEEEEGGGEKKKTREFGREEKKQGERKEAPCPYSTMSTNDEMSVQRKQFPALSSCKEEEDEQDEEKTSLSHCISSMVAHFNDTQDKHVHSLGHHESSSDQVKLYNTISTVKPCGKQTLDAASSMHIDQDNCRDNEKSHENMHFDRAYIVPPCLRLMIESYQFKSAPVSAVLNDCLVSSRHSDYHHHHHNHHHNHHQQHQRSPSSSSWCGNTRASKMDECKGDNCRGHLLNAFNVHPQSIKYHGQHYSSNTSINSGSGGGGGGGGGIHWSYGSCINETVSNGQEDEASTREIKDLQSQVKCSKEKVSDLTSQLFANAQMMSAFEKTLSTLSTKLQQLTLVNHQKDMEINRLRAVTDVMIAYKAEQEKCNSKKCHAVKQPQQSSPSSPPQSQSNDHKDNLSDSNSINSMPSSPSKRLWIKSTLNKAFLKNKITQSPSKKLPPPEMTVKESSSSNLSHASSSSSSSLSCGWTADSTGRDTQVATEEDKHDKEKETQDSVQVKSESSINELREKLSKADCILEKTRLEAITSAFHLENTKELVNTLREEAMYLRQVNSQLELNVKKKQSSLYHGSHQQLHEPHHHHGHHHQMKGEKASAHNNNKHQLLLC